MNIGHIDLNRQVLVIAEIGNNHEGSFTLAQELVGLAAEAGADAVKFQTIVPELLVSRDNQPRLAQLQKFQLTHARLSALARQAQNLGVIFLSTPFDIESARFLNTIQPAFKIASGLDNCLPPLMIMRAFVQMRRFLAANAGLLQRLGAADCSRSVVVYYPKRNSSERFFEDSNGTASNPDFC